MTSSVSDAEFDDLLAGSLAAQKAREVQSYQEGRMESNQPTNRVTNQPGEVTRGRYPWASWMDGKWHVAQRGIDYDCSVVEFQNRLHNAGRRKDMWCHSKRIAEGNVEFCFFATQAERERAKVGWGDDPI